jgi:hypothetical protein
MTTAASGRFVTAGDISTRHSQLKKCHASV